MTWNIYNKQYDLTKYMDKHPGGKDILLKCKNEKDLTVLFETYHAFSDKKRIKQILNNYEINTNINNNNKIYDFTNYNKLLEEVKILFPNRESIKADTFFVIQNSIVFSLYCFFFFNAMFSTYYSIYIKCLFTCISGLLCSSIFFNILHDGSHYSISIYPSVNNILNKISNSLVLTNSNIWFYHHIINHHSFTGEENLDPDLYHFFPFGNKLKSNSKQLFSIMSYYTLFFVLFIPGQGLLQIIHYIFSQFTHKLFIIKLPNVLLYDITDISIILCKLYFLYNGGIILTILYLIILNFLYHINVALNHDTYETNIENRYEGDDWLKLQVCNSGNFLNGNMIWTKLFGSINYQIEHHLFPNMSNSYYPIIAPIVKKFCEERNIPYVNHTTLWGGYKSYLKMLKINNS